MTPQRLSLAARMLLRLCVPPGGRAEVEADLHELFRRRRRERGAVHAHWRLYHDVISLWRQPGGAATSPSLLGFVRDIPADLRYAARLFARQPGILLLTIGGLALGLGIATATFSIMNAAVIRGEGIVDPDRAPGVLRTTGNSTATVWAYDEFLHLREGSTRMQVEAVLTDATTLRTTQDAIAAPSVDVAFVSGGFFAAAGARMALGRTLVAADERHIGPPPVVVSFVFWSSALDRDPAVVGRTIRVGRTDATIVGVAARGFSAPGDRLLWIPMTAYGAVYGAAPRKRTPDVVQVFGRLIPDASLPEAEAQLSGVAGALRSGTIDADSRLQTKLDPDVGLGRMNAAETTAITAFVAAVIGLVLLLACANVASVLVSTAITREREMGLRAALGASRRRIVRQLVTESLALGTVAAAFGLMLTYWGVPMVGTMIEVQAGADLAPDLNVYLFLGVVTFVTSVTAGLAPTWHGRGADLVTPLKGADSNPNRVAPRRLRSLLVVTQAAASVLLIVLAAFFMRASVSAAKIDVGFDPTGLYAVSAALPGPASDGGAAIRNFWTRATSELEAVPGIASATLTELPPFGGATRSAVTREQPSRVVYLNRTRPEYFETLGLRVLAGRAYTPEEVAATAPVAVVSRSLARSYWQDQSPLGQTLPDVIPVAQTRPTIIGVVDDSVTARLHESNALAVYEPLDPGSEIFAQLLIRVDAEATGAMNEAGQRLRAIDPQADVRIMSVAAQLQQEAAQPRTLAALTGVIGLVAIVLCVIGLYGLTASVVGQREKEMGIRAAMGAEPRDLLRMLMWDSLKPVVAGLVLGTAATLLIGRITASTMFFGVSPQDPISFAGATVVLLTATMLAVIVPTRRAAGVDAAVVLRRS